MNPPRPNFLIAGTGKAGTTSLHEYLGQHPGIFMSANKEPHYFVHGYGIEQWEDYLQLFAAAGGKKAVGESSTLYLYCPESAPWIKATLADIKIVLLLRNPAKRAFSLYGWMVREGYEDSPTFAEALDREPGRLDDPEFRRTCPQFYPDYLYYTTGLYSGQVRRYFDTFGRDRVRVYLFEDFVKQPLAVCRDVFEFVGVDPDFVPRMEVHNEGRVPARIPLQFWLRNRAGRSLAFIPGRWRRRMIAAWMERNIRCGGKPVLDAHTHARLAQRYQQDVRQLEDLLDRDLSLWGAGAKALPSKS